MRKILVHEFISLDGVIQAPGSPTLAGVRIPMRDPLNDEHEENNE